MKEFVLNISPEDLQDAITRHILRLRDGKPIRHKSGDVCDAIAIACASIVAMADATGSDIDHLTYLTAGLPDMIARAEVEARNWPCDDPKRNRHLCPCPACDARRRREMREMRDQWLDPVDPNAKVDKTWVS